MCAMRRFALLATIAETNLCRICGTSLEGTYISRRSKTVAKAGRSYGRPSEKFVGGFAGNFQKLPPNFSEVAFTWKSPDAMHFGATS